MIKFHIIRQYINEQGLTYEIADGKKLYKLFSGKLEDANSEYSGSVDCCSTFELNNSSWDAVTLAKYENLFQSLCTLFPYKKTHTSQIPIDKLLSLYVISTYCFNLFDSHGILLLSDVLGHIILDLLHTLRKVCFNGYIVKPHDGLRPIRDFISSNSATLLFEEPNKYRPAIQKLCLISQNHSSQQYHLYENATISSNIYSSKAIVTSRSNYEQIYRYAAHIYGHSLLPTCLEGNSSQDICIAALHFSLVAQKTISRAIEQIGQSISNNNPYFFLVVMARALELLGLIEPNDAEQVSNALKHFMELYQRERAFNVEKEILRIAAYFVRDHGYGDSDEVWIPTEAFIAFIKTSKDVDSIFKSIVNPKKLISTLTKNGITKTNKRVTVDLTDEEGNKTDRRPRMCYLWDIRILKVITGINTNRKGIKNDTVGFSPTQTTEMPIRDERD